MESWIVTGDILALTETWLSADCYSSEYFDSADFTVYRNDRVGRRGGGVLLAVRALIASRAFDLGQLSTTLSGINLTGAVISYNGADTPVIVIHIPPAAPVSLLTDVLDDLSAILHDVAIGVVILGDFNVPGFKNHILGESMDRAATVVAEFMELSGRVPN